VLGIPLKPDCNLATEKFLAFKELKWSSPCLQKPVTGILSMQNSVHNLIPCLCKIHFSIIIPSSWYINWASTEQLRNQNSISGWGKRFFSSSKSGQRGPISTASSSLQGKAVEVCTEVVQHGTTPPLSHTPS